MRLIHRSTRRFTVTEIGRLRLATLRGAGICQFPTFVVAEDLKAGLLSGEVNSLEAIARRFRVDRGHARLVLNLAFLNPVLARAIVAGEQPPGLRLSQLLSWDTPLAWQAQERAFGLAIA